MRIAILGSVALPVPPPFQGGTEWIAYFQAKGLSERGHQVLLFGAEGSSGGPYTLVTVGKGNTVAGSSRNTSEHDVGIESSRALRVENVYLSQVMQELINRRDQYDVILNNMRGEAVFVPLANMLGKKFVNVMHLPMFAELAEYFQTTGTQVITISDNQRKEFPDLTYIRTVYNCVDTSIYVPKPNDVHVSDPYLLMVGTIGRHKNQAAAIDVARALNMRLVLAGKIRDQEYFDELKPLIDDKQIIWKGEMGFEEKLALYQGAKAFIFPINWEEPFGLVLIEAMACGIPVVAFDRGAIREVVVDGKTGYIVHTQEQMIESLRHIDQINPVDCRNHVLEHFSIETMVAAYEEALK